MTSRRLAAFRRDKKRATSNIFSLFDQPQITEFKEAFNMIDQNHDGLITSSDLKEILSSLGKNPTQEYIDKMMDESRGPLNFTMFLILFGERLSHTDSEDTIKASFECFDDHQTGLIAEEVFRESLSTMGERFSDDYIDEIFRLFPAENGFFNYMNFIKSIKHGAKDKIFQSTEKSLDEV